jgi:hypothetical protein
MHMWVQIVGKVRMAHITLLNHWRQVTSYLSPRELTTGAVPYRNALFDMEFDFVHYRLVVRHAVRTASQAHAVHYRVIAQVYSSPSSGSSVG